MVHNSSYTHKIVRTGQHIILQPNKALHRKVLNRNSHERYLHWIKGRQAPQWNQDTATCHCGAFAFGQKYWKWIIVAGVEWWMLEWCKLRDSRILCILSTYSHIKRFNGFGYYSIYVQKDHLRAWIRFKILIPVQVWIRDRYIVLF